MYRKIIVPLDGSKLAEQVLPHLNQIAKGCGVTEVVLVTVTEKIKGKTNIVTPGDYVAGAVGQSVIYVDRFMASKTTINPAVRVNVTVGKMAKTGFDYLTKIAKKLEKQDIPTSVAVLLGDVSEEIVRFAQAEKADLIIMATKGKKSLKKWDVANAGEKVLQKVENIPVLLVKPPYGFSETKPVRKGKSS